MLDKTPDFMLEEYKQIANGYQDLHAQHNELIRFYLTLVAIPSTILALVAQFADKLPGLPAAETAVAQATATLTPGATQALAPAVQLTASPGAVATPIAVLLLIALIIIGVAVFMALIRTRTEALYYVKTVNAVRRYFVEHDADGRLSKYLVLPDYDAVPTYWERTTSRAFWNVMMVAALNSAIICSTAIAVLEWLRLTTWAVPVGFGAFPLVLALHEIIHYRTLSHADATYTPKFPRGHPAKGQEIGIDLDGVLDNLAEAVVSKAESMFGISIDPREITSHRLQDCTPLNDAQVNQIFASSDIFESVRPLAGACYALKELQRDHWTIHVITDRFWSKRDWETAQAWLTKHDFPWDRLDLVHAGEKTAYAKAHHIEVFVEDNYETAASLSSVCRTVYLIDWPYNQGPDLDNLIRCQSWIDILRNLTRLANHQAS
jgi:uncharacterized HAD superfamily protein